MKNNLILLLLLVSATVGHSQSWEKINTGFNYIFKGIEFPGGQSQVGFAGGQSLTYNGDGIVIKTTNGGSTWTSLWTGVEQGVEGISFPDMNTGYIGGWSAYFAKTINGGVSWTPQNPGSDIWYYTDVVFKDATHGVVTASTNSSGGGVYFTSDGGTTWATGTGLSGVPYKVCYVTGDTYFLVTNGGDIQKSTNGGLSWVTVYAAGGMLLGIDFYNSTTGMAAGEDGRILKTFDGGVTWQQQITAFGQPLWHDFAWASQNEVYSVGTPEFIYKSQDGGATWTDDFPQSTYNPALYEALVTPDGIGYICGSQGWFYRKAPELSAGFTAGNTHVCNGGSIQFTDQSVGSPTAWNWTFEGGTPSTSTQQNPLVTYSLPGVYDVSLTVTIGAITSSITHSDFIFVEAPVTTVPAQPAGLTSLCGLSGYQYITSSVPSATGYAWTADPATAGTFSGTGITGTLTTSNTWNGAFTIQVAGTNACGAGPVSQVLSCTLYHQPNVYPLLTGGGFCPGQPGYEIRLIDSDQGVDYQLYRDGIPSGSLVPGTGNEINFGFQPVGTYTVSGTNASCNATMQGASTVYLIDPPAAAAQPAGPAISCSNVPSTFTCGLPANGFTLAWTLDPAAAGTVTQPTLTSALVTWNPGFAGAVAISVQGQNECGNGPSSPLHTIMVEAVPTPVIEGNTTVCVNQELTYSVGAVTGSNFAWEVAGGTITSGQGSNHITVLWSNQGTGSVSVTETSLANCTGTSPVLSVAVDPCTSIPDRESGMFNIYPNPAKDQLLISTGSLPFGSSVSISIFNSTGLLVFRSEGIKCTGQSTVNIDVSYLAAGIYSIKVNHDETVFNRLFVKQ